MSHSTAHETGVLASSRGSAASRVRPAGEVPLPGVPAAFTAVSPILRDLLHEMRGSLTALESYLALLEERHGSALDEAGGALLGGAAANAEHLSVLAEALALVASSGVSRPLAVRDLLVETADRWKKFLSRHRLTLNLLGDLPDKSLDGRSAGVVLGLLVTLGAEALGHAGGRLELSAEERGTEVIVSLSALGPTVEAGAAAALLRAATAPGRFVGTALKAALETLGGSLALGGRRPASGGCVSFLLRMPARGVS